MKFGMFDLTLLALNSCAAEKMREPDASRFEHRRITADVKAFPDSETAEAKKRRESVRCHAHNDDFMSGTRDSDLLRQVPLESM